MLVKGESSRLVAVTLVKSVMLKVVVPEREKLKKW